MASGSTLFALGYFSQYFQLLQHPDKCFLSCGISKNSLSETIYLRCHSMHIWFIPGKSLGNSAKILYTKISDKMAYANSKDLDQTAPEGAV